MSDKKVYLQDIELAQAADLPDMTNYYTKAEIYAAIQADIEALLPPRSLHPFFADTSSSKWVQFEYIARTRMHFIKNFTSNGWATFVRNAGGVQDTLFASIFPASLASLEASVIYDLKIEAYVTYISNPENISINILNSTTNNQLNPISGAQQSVLLSDITPQGAIVPMTLSGALSNPRLLSIQVRDTSTGAAITDGEFKLRFSLTEAS